MELLPWVPVRPSGRTLPLPALLGGACPQGMLAIVSLGEDGYVAYDRSARD